jgi:hypothetical protein
MDKSLEDERGMKPFPRSVTAAFFSFILFGLSSFILSKKKKKKTTFIFTSCHLLPVFFISPPPHSSTEMLSAATFRKWRLKFASYDGENLFHFHSENNNNKKKATNKKEK